MKKRFHVIVRPGLLQQDKWSVYLIPTDQPGLELTYANGIATREEAVTIAEHISENYPAGIVFEKGVTVHDSAPQPKGEYEHVTGDEPTLSGYLEDYLKDTFKQINKLRPSMITIEPKKWLESLLMNPITLAIIGILVYYFDFDINAPKWLEPILPDKLSSTSQLIIAIPLLMFVLEVRSVFRRRSQSYSMNVIRNYLLTLIFKYHWGLDKLLAPARKELGKIEHSAFSQVADKLAAIDPDAYPNLFPGDVVQSEQIGQAEQNDTTDTILRELYFTVLINDFERRVHALLFLEKESWYRPNKIYFHPYLFLVAYESRSVRFQAIKQVAQSGGTLADFAQLYRQHASYRVVMYYLGVMIGSLILYGLIGFALYLSVEEAAQLSSSWLVFAVTCAFFALAIPLQYDYRFLLKGQGRPRGFLIWEIG